MGCNNKSTLEQAGIAFRDAPRTSRQNEWENFSKELQDRLDNKGQQSVDAVYLEQLIGPSLPEDFAQCQSLMRLGGNSPSSNQIFAYLVEEDDKFGNYITIDFRDPPNIRIRGIVVAYPSQLHDEHDKIPQEEKLIATSLGARSVNLCGGSQDGTYKPGYSVVLSGAQVTHEQMQEVSNLSTLVYLNLEGQQVTDQILSIISGHDYLASLTIRNASISHIGILSLKNCSHLKWLRLVNTPVSSEAIRQLEVALSQCEITVKGAQPAHGLYGENAD